MEKSFSKTKIIYFLPYGIRIIYIYTFNVKGLHHYLNVNQLPTKFIFINVYVGCVRVRLDIINLLQYYFDNIVWHRLNVRDV